MVYFFYGTNAVMAREKARKLLEKMKKEAPSSEIFHINSENFDALNFENLIGGRGLFGSANIINCNGIFDNEEAKEFFVARVEDISESPNVFILSEGKVDAETARAVKSRAEETIKCDNDTEKEKPDYSFSDAFATADKKKLWVLLRKKIDGGEPLEQIHGTLFWQLKNMLLALECSDASEAGLHPFVFRRNKIAAEKIGKKHLRELSARLVSIYHDSHRGIHDFETALERFVLKM
jgi:DNA polymerase III delta subunit